MNAIVFDPEAPPCLAALRERGTVAGVAGNNFTANETQREPRGVTDVAAAPAFGMRAVHIRRGPSGHLHQTPSPARRIDSLPELVS